MKKLLLVLMLGICLVGCREDEVVVPTEYDIIPEEVQPGRKCVGMYLLNEGNMGSNKSTLDYVDFEQGYYVRNLYAERNPQVVKELGDVGNDIQIYGSRIYAVINCSNKIEVLDARTARRIGQIDIPNVRYVRFHKGYAYATSYVGPVQLNNPNAVQGAVYKIDTLSLKTVGRCAVGYQPDELCVLGQYIYVANSGGYMAPNYDKTVSVIEIEGFKQVEKIPVGINLHPSRQMPMVSYGLPLVATTRALAPNSLYWTRSLDAMRCRLQIRSTYLALTFVSVVTRCIIMPRSGIIRRSKIPSAMALSM